jgi:hypothetical protein
MAEAGRLHGWGRKSTWLEQEEYGVCSLNFRKSVIKKEQL